jgi:hypothetical protein
LAKASGAPVTTRAALRAATAIERCEACMGPP